MRTDHIKYRNMLGQLGLYIVTLGIYGVYWYYSTLKELHIANGKNEGAGLWTVLSRAFGIRIQDTEHSNFLMPIF